jgi:hypothetical protein
VPAIIVEFPDLFLFQDDRLFVLRSLLLIIVRFGLKMRYLNAAGF